MEHEGIVKEIAAERISILYDLAREHASDDIRLSKECVKTLRRISAHYKVKIPKKLKEKICRSCNLVLIPGLTASVRIASGKGYVVYRCKECGRERHIFYRARGSGKPDA
jgi:ribonuclease P protein subunit RPR2